MITRCEGNSPIFQADDDDGWGYLIDCSPRRTVCSCSGVVRVRTDSVILFFLLLIVVRTAVFSFFSELNYTFSSFASSSSTHVMTPLLLVHRDDDDGGGTDRYTGRQRRHGTALRLSRLTKKVISSSARLNTPLVSSRTRTCPKAGGAAFVPLSCTRAGNSPPRRHTLTLFARMSIDTCGISTMRKRDK